jgi:hypothetical protein
VFPCNKKKVILKSSNWCKVANQYVCLTNNFIFLRKKMLIFMMFYLKVNQRLPVKKSSLDQWDAVTFFNTRKLKGIGFGLILSEMLATILDTVWWFSCCKFCNLFFTGISGRQLAVEASQKEPRAGELPCESHVKGLVHILTIRPTSGQTWV